MSKGSKKSAKAKSATSTQTAKRHTTVPAAAAATAIARPEPVAAPSHAAPAVTAVVTPVEVAPAEATATAVAEPDVSVALTPIDTAAVPVVDGQLVIGLISDLRHEDADIAREAAVALGATGSPAAVEALIEVLENADGFYHSVVRSAAASSLARLGDKRAVASLLCAVNDTMAEASAEAVRALADLGDARAVETLVGVVQNVTGFFQPVVRLAAVHALGRFDAPQAEAELAHVAADPSEDTVIRDAAGE
jgi:HEAT repeat protein